MPTHAAFLRAINVGGRRITNDALREACAASGLEEAATFRASGNVVFTAARRVGEGTLARRIEEGLERELGFAVPAYVRSAAQLRAIAAHVPLDPKLVDGSEGKLQVVFLTGKPSPASRREALGLAGDRDLLALRSRELYWLPSGGLMESELDRKALDRLLGPSTVRTKGTVDLLAEKFFAR
jgi:uncharacterized protein (DUF1697 family)